MRYKATPQCQTALYSILLCHREEKRGGTQQKANISRKQKKKNKKGENFLSKPSRPLNVTVLYISTIEIQKWSTLWQIYFTGQREREKFNCIFIQQHFKSTGGENACSDTPPPLFSKSLPGFYSIFSPLFKILNMLKT